VDIQIIAPACREVLAFAAALKLERLSVADGPSAEGMVLIVNDFDVVAAALGAHGLRNGRHRVRNLDGMIGWWRLLASPPPVGAAAGEAE